MGKRRYRRKRESLEVRVQEHQGKIKAEQEKPTPDEGRIRYWQREIRAFQDGLRRARRRLGGRG